MVLMLALAQVTGVAHSYSNGQTLLPHSVYAPPEARRQSATVTPNNKCFQVQPGPDSALGSSSQEPAAGARQGAGG
eukprot:327398-Rhodomonas_salina.1